MFLEEQVTPGAFLFIACTWKWTESIFILVISSVLHKSTQSTYYATRIYSYLSYFYLVTQIHPVNVLCHQDLFLSQLFLACYTDPPSRLPLPRCSDCTALSGYLNLSSRLLVERNNTSDINETLAERGLRVFHYTWIWLQVLTQERLSHSHLCAG